MTEKSRKKGFLRTEESSDNAPPKRGRGRPKGAKNKPKVDSVAQIATTEKRGRGRPKGAKNKPKLPPPSPEPVLEKPKRGRPKKETVSIIQKETVISREETHPILEAAAWLEKHMSPIELAHYRRRAAKSEVSLHCAMVHDILGIFNVRDPEICKQFKKITN